MHVYRGWKSTKLHLALITMVLLTVLYICMGCPETQFSTFTVALLGATGIYSGAAAAEKFAARAEVTAPFTKLDP